MYAIGDKIVYPPYGAGVIDDIEEKDVDGQLLSYYVLHIPVGNLKIMISAAKAKSLGVRVIYPKDEMLQVIKGVLDKPIIMADNWNQRYKDNMEFIKSGNLADVALVYRNLLLRERERGLSTAEKKMMTTAKQIILSELILSQEVDKPKAENILDITFG
ncbi:MAG: CarD family transcriptional regulator [Defluviitaleaceae bacterium]|nr:CarD family transcriptional regulator [Defluviitaleaceae bacterium]MCL2275128.1 CarD family transcriptional regulator [Defluviitaleaceae bacterium]